MDAWLYSNFVSSLLTLNHKINKQALVEGSQRVVNANGVWNMKWWRVKERMGEVGYWDEVLHARYVLSDDFYEVFGKYQPPAVIMLNVSLTFSVKKCSISWLNIF